MTTLIPYIARSGLYLSLFYAFYLLIMRRTTFFRLNRVILLAGSYLCMVFPIIRLRTVATAVSTEPLTIVGTGTVGTTSASFPWQEVLLCLYVSGIIFLLARYGMSVWKMSRLIRKGQRTKMDGLSLVLLEEDIPSFSWGREVVMGRKDLEQNPAIFTHEKMHVQCRHSLDILLILPIHLIFWWNPLVWITREELRLLHEFEADERVIQNGIDATQYQLLLVRKAVGEQRFTLANGFQHAKLKNRITMMLKPSTSCWARWSYLAIVPVLTACMFACNPTKNDNVTPSETGIVEKETVAQEEAIPSPWIEEAPTFNSKNTEEFFKWLDSQLVYPEKAKEDGVQGRVLMQFTVGTDGYVKDVKVLKGIREDLDAEAVRAVSSSPKWKPGTNGDGTPVAVTFTFPITFNLK